MVDTNNVSKIYTFTGASSGCYGFSGKNTDGDSASESANASASVFTAGIERKSCPSDKPEEPSFWDTVKKFLFGDSDNDLQSISAFNNNFNLYQSLGNREYTPKHVQNENFNTNTNLPSLQNVYNPVLGKKLAQIALDNAIEGKSGDCAHYVSNYFEQGKFTQKGQTRVGKNGSAYEVADKLAACSNFKEVQVAKCDLKNLPAGAVLVRDPSAGHEHGHITVMLGQKDASGNALCASDHPEKLIENSTVGYRVFIPVGCNS